MAIIPKRFDLTDGLAEQVELEARLALGRLVWARWAFLGVAVAMMAFWAVSGNDPRIVLTGLTILLPFAAYNYWLARRLRRAGVAPWLNYVSVTVDLLLVTGYLLLLSYRTSPLDMVVSALNLGYPLVMLYAAFRLDRRLLVYTTILALVCHNGLYLARSGALTAEALGLAPTLGPWGQVARALIMLIFGLGLWLIPKTVHALLRRQEALFKATRDLEERYRRQLEEEVALKTQGLTLANHQLQKALDDVQTLRGLLPICSRCKKVRDEAGQWHQMEEYISSRTPASITHGLCQECLRSLYPDIADEVLAEAERSGAKG